MPMSRNGVPPSIALRSAAIAEALGEVAAEVGFHQPDVASIWADPVLSESRKGDWIQTFTGKQFWPLDPRAEDVDIVDIAHSLSMQCRYNGHCREFYSVAEHCFRMSFRVRPENALAALLHDAAEAYLSDVPRPIKPQLAGYKEMEHAIEKVVAEKFGVQYPWPDEIHNADERLLADEMEALMAPPPVPWNLRFKGFYDGDFGDVMTAAEAKKAFLARFEILTEEAK
jgi:uncharacterized protein